jgi:hypothetical protein
LEKDEHAAYVIAPAQATGISRSIQSVTDAWRGNHASSCRARTARAQELEPND